MSYAAVRGAECLRPGRAAVLRQRRGPRSRACWECILSRAGTGNVGCLAARAADAFWERLGRAECGGSQIGRQRPHQGKRPIRRPEFRRKAWSPGYPLNGVLHAAHALGYSPTSSAAFGSCDPLCAQRAPDANDAWPRTECPLASVEGRWSPLASVVVRQSDDNVT